MTEQKVHRKMGQIVSGATIVGAILILLSIYLPWFYFTGVAEYYWGTVEVSGHISAVGIGRLDRNGATVTMWSTATHWSSAESDFWFGYLSLAGLFLVAASVIVFMKTYKTKISTLLALIGGPMAVLAGVIATICYKPALFIITGQIYISEYQSTQDAWLYAEKATLISGLGPCLSIIGGLIPIISMVLAFYKVQIGGIGWVSKFGLVLSVVSVALMLSLGLLSIRGVVKYLLSHPGISLVDILSLSSLSLLVTNPLCIYYLTRPQVKQYLGSKVERLI